MPRTRLGSSLIVVILLCTAHRSSAQDAATQSPPDASASAPTQHDKRIFGVLPNYATVERDEQQPPITTSQRFHMAALNSFDPFVYPFVGFAAGVAQLRSQEPTWGGGMSGYGRHYAAAFADNTIGNMLTTAVMPTLLRQDPRYFVLGDGGFWRRAGYAASRIAITRGVSGGAQFNVSEIGGNMVGGVVSNLYYPSDSRSASDTLQRASMQIVWDLASNELKEFWPDIRHVWHHRATQPPK